MLPISSLISMTLRERERVRLGGREVTAETDTEREKVERVAAPVVSILL